MLHVLVAVAMPGVALSQQDAGIIFNLTKDTDLMAFVDSKKTPLCFANLACLVAKTKGLTELTVEDHSITQRFSQEPVVVSLGRKVW